MTGIVHLLGLGAGKATRFGRGWLAGISHHKTVVGRNPLPPQRGGSFDAVLTHLAQG
jgi:hypothetical protein